MRIQSAFSPSVHRLWSIAVVLALLLTTAFGVAPPVYAEPDAGLSIVPVSAPAINCLFDADCTITVNDLASNFTPPGASGNGFLQSRLWPVGEARTAGAGLYAYLYRIDLRKAMALTAISCVDQMIIDFGPVAKLDYNGDKTPDDVFVVTQGGIGNSSPATANQTGDAITFTFKPAICPGSRAAGDSSFFFGLASTQSAQDVTARLTGSLSLDETLAARAPKIAKTLSGKIAYVFDDNTTVAPAFQGFLQAQGFTVTLVHLNNVLTTDFSTFDLTIVADDTGYLKDWGNATGQVEHIAKNSPVLGLAEGGYAFFGKLNLNIGWPKGWHTTLDTVVGNAALSFYQTPNDLTGLLGAPLPIANPAVKEVGIHLPEPVAGVTVLGTEPTSATHHPLIAEGCNQLWGYNNVPALNMTGDGEKLFVNAVVYAMNQCKRQPPTTCEEIFSPRQIPSAARVNFDDLPDATKIGDSYAASHGLHFYQGNDTTVITYADRESNLTKARSAPNIARNAAISPTTSSDVPMTFSFDQPKSHVGFYMGNGAEQKLRGTLVAYDANDKVICQVTNSPVPESYTEFIGVQDKQGRIAKITLDYGETSLSEAIDDVYFAPYDKPAVFPEPENPPMLSIPPTVTIESSTNQTFTAKIDLPEPQFIPVKGGDNISYTHMILPGVDIYGNAPGLPDVPVVRRLLGVPRGAQVKLAGLQVIPGDEFSIVLYPAQQSSVDTPLVQGGDGELPPETFADPPFAKNQEAYATDQLFPAEIVSIQPVGQMRDLDLVQINIAAGQYNPKSKLLKRFKSVKFEILFEGGEGGFLPKKKMDNSFEQSFDGNYAQVINQAALPNYPFEEILSPFSCVGHEFIIVTDPAFRPAADALRTWKVSRGLSTLVVETGNDAIDAGTTRDQIRNYVRSRYNNCLVRPSYLLLLGDAEQIPVFYRAPSGAGAAYAGTDLDYSLMSNGSDIMPDLAYGRIPVDTLEDANRVVNKIINYENLPPVNQAFYKNMTFASYFQCCRNSTPNDGTDSRSFLETSELLRGMMQAKGYTVERIYDTSRAYHDNPASGSYYPPSRSAVPNRYYNGALLPADLRASSGYVWDGNSSDVINAFNDSRFLILHRDHGGPSGWGDPGFGTSNLASLINGNRTPVVYSINCASGLFDNETLNPAIQDWNYNTAVGSSYWAERLLRMDGGAVGIIGDTRNSPTWANSALTRGLFDATWPTTLPGYGGNKSYRRLGDILNYAKAYVVSQVGVPQPAGSVSNGDASTEIVLYHVYGDPTMKMWTSNPYVINFPWYIYENLTINLGSFEVHYPINGATITALQDGAPVGRAAVVDGKAVLTFIDKVDPGRPVDFSASNPDGTGALLGQAEADGTITPDLGDLIEHLPSKFSLEFDDGSVNVDTDIFYDVRNGPSQPLPMGSKGLRFFNLDAFDEAASDGNPAPVTQFAKPFSLALGYTDADLAAMGIDEASLSCHYLDTADKQWKTISSQVDAAKNQVTCAADHFTEFALAGNSATPLQSVFLPVVRK